MSASIRWIIGKQTSDGSFPEPGKVIHTSMQVIWLETWKFMNSVITKVTHGCTTRQLEYGSQTKPVCEHWSCSQTPEPVCDFRSLVLEIKNMSILCLVWYLISCTEDRNVSILIYVWDLFLCTEDTSDSLPVCVWDMSFYTGDTNVSMLACGWDITLCTEDTNLSVIYVRYLFV